MLPGLALLPLLNRPGGLAHVIHGVPEFAQNALIDRARAHVILQLNQVRAGFFELEIHAPERFARDKKFNGHSEQPALGVAADTDDASLREFMRKTVGYLNLSSDGGVRLHLQQATLRVHFRGLSRLTENFAIRLLPRCFYRRDERKTPAPPLSGC